MAPPGPANDSRLLNQPRPLCVCVCLCRDRILISEMNWLDGHNLAQVGRPSVSMTFMRMTSMMTCSAPHEVPSSRWTAPEIRCLRSQSRCADIVRPADIIRQAC